MSSGLEAIAKELRRLQRNGVNHIFVEDGTMQLIVPEKRQDPNLSTARQNRKWSQLKVYNRKRCKSQSHSTSRAS